MDKIINFNILKNPLNWITVILMVSFGMLALSFFLTWAQGSKSKQS